MAGKEWRQNIKLDVRADVWEAAKIIAREDGRTLSGWITVLVTKAVTEEVERREAERDRLKNILD